MKPALHPQGSGSPIFRWRRSLSGPSAGPCRHLPGCPRAATGAHRTAKEGVKVAHSSRQAAADSGQPRRFRRERAQRNPGWSLGPSERAQTLTSLGAGGNGSAGGQPGSQLSLGSPSPRNQSAWQSGSLCVCSVLPSPDVRGFLLGRKQCSSACPGQMPARPKAQGSRRETKFRDLSYPAFYRGGLAACRASLAGKECVLGRKDSFFTRTWLRSERKTLPLGDKCSDTKMGKAGSLLVAAEDYGESASS